MILNALGVTIFKIDRLEMNSVQIIYYISFFYFQVFKQLVYFFFILQREWSFCTCKSITFVDDWAGLVTLNSSLIFLIQFYNRIFLIVILIIHFCVLACFILILRKLIETYIFNTHFNLLFSYNFYLISLIKRTEFVSEKNNLCTCVNRNVVRCKVFVN